MSINLDNFDLIKAKGEELYKSFGPIKCPYFNDFVHFNAEGLEHLRYKFRNRDRLAQDQYMRFKLLHLAPQVLKLSRTLQGLSSRQGFERIRRNSTTKLEFVTKVYYEFVAIIDGIRVRIIVRQIKDGELHFWSIIPFWTELTDHSRVFGFGNPEED